MSTVSPSPVGDIVTDPIDGYAWIDGHLKEGYQLKTDKGGATPYTSRNHNLTTRVTKALCLKFNDELLTVEPGMEVTIYRRRVHAKCGERIATFFGQGLQVTVVKDGELRRRNVEVIEAVTRR